MKGKRRCRMHGGTNPGAPKGNRNAHKHGGRSAATLAAARYLKLIARLLRSVSEPHNGLTNLFRRPAAGTDTGQLSGVL